MKRNTPEHWKVWLLKDTLSIGLAQAVGHLELLWHFTAASTTDGHIGKFTNSFIAEMSGWEGDPDRFIDALVTCKWVDACETRRLVIHDWSDHRSDNNRRGYNESIRRRREVEAGGSIPKHIRMAIFQRDGHACLICGDTEDLTIDHIIPISRGGKNDNNLQTLCRPCNSRKKDRVPHG